MIEKIGYKNRLGKSSLPLIETKEFAHEITSPKKSAIVRSPQNRKAANNMPLRRSLKPQIILQTPFLNTDLEDDAFSPQAQIEQAFAQVIERQHNIREFQKHTDPKQLASIKKEQLEHDTQKKVQSLVNQAKKRIGMDLKKSDKEYKFKKTIAKFKTLDTYFDVSDLLKNMAQNPQRFEKITSPTLKESKFVPAPNLLADENTQEKNEKDQQAAEEALQEIQRMRAQDKFRAAQDRAQKFKVAMIQPKNNEPRASRVIKNFDVNQLARAFKEKVLKQKIKEKVDIEVEKSSNIRKNIRNSTIFYGLKNYLEKNEIRAVSPEEKFDETTQKQYWDDILVHLQDLYDKEVGGRVKLMAENDVDDNVTEYIQAIQSRLRKDLVREEEDMKITERLLNYKSRSDKIVNMLKTTTSYIYNMKWGQNHDQDNKKVREKQITPALDCHEQEESDDFDYIKALQSEREQSLLEDQANQEDKRRDPAPKSLEIKVDDESPAKKSSAEKVLELKFEGESHKILSNPGSPVELKPSYQRSNSTKLSSIETPTPMQGKNNFSQTFYRKSSMQLSDEENSPISQFSPKFKAMMTKSESKKEISPISPAKSAFADSKLKKSAIETPTSEPKLAMQRRKFSSFALSPSAKNQLEAFSTPQKKLLINISHAKSHRDSISTELSFRRKLLGNAEIHSVRDTPDIKNTGSKLTKILHKTSSSEYSFGHLTHQKSLSQIQTKFNVLESDTFKLKKGAKRVINKINRTMDKLGNFYEKKYREYLIRCEKVPTSLLKPTVDEDFAKKKRRAFADNLTKKLLSAVN